MTAYNFVDENGLHLETYDEIKTRLEDGFRGIYGDDINLDSNSPDGQMVGFLTQLKIDMLNCIAQVYNSFSPTNAVGVALKQRCALNGVVPRGSSYTRTDITLTTDRVVALPGLDTAPTAPYTVADNAGNQFYLEESVSSAIGENVLTFRAAQAGAVSTTIDTITTAVTVMLGVLSVNNPTSYITLGVDEELDPALRERRTASVARPSTAWLPGMRAALLALDGVYDAQVYENTDNSADGNNIPAHGIWAIVDGGAEADIADVLYRKRNAGVPMAGAYDVEVAQINGQAFTVHFDRAIYADLYIEFSVTSFDTSHSPDPTFLADGIVAGIAYSIGEAADFTAIIALIKQLDPLAVIETGGVSASLSGFASYVAAATIQSRWLVSSDRINITVI